MRCPQCNSPDIRKTVVLIDEETQLYQCNNCELLFNSEAKWLFKGEDVPHKFNPTARDGKD